MRAPRSASLLAVLLTLAAVPGCAGRRGKDTDATTTATGTERTTVRVENQSFSDMTIYVVRSGSERIRLGLAGGNRTTVLPIPPYLVQFPIPLRFLADPIGGNRQPISSEITVSPGDEVVVQLPPN